jgi:hypothetical protein
MNVLNYEKSSVSVAIKEIKPQDWTEKVYKPDIVSNPEKLYKEHCPRYLVIREPKPAHKKKSPT